MIVAVGVVVPARDEAKRLPACLRTLGTALRALPPQVDRAVCVVADRCRDDTARIAGTQALVNRAELPIGAVRSTGIAAVRGRLGHPDPRHTLLLSTDADSTVAPDWAVRHLRWSDRAWDGVAGVARLPRLPWPADLRYQAVLDGTRGPRGHGNVYGANLGVRASAYDAVGGFRPLATGEDHDLWQRLGRAGFRLAFADEVLVATSARLRGRAPGGLAALLRSLHAEPGAA